MHYEIRVKGHLDQCWATWFDGMVLTAETNGDTVISGRVIDQSALHSLLSKVHHLNLTLISVLRTESGIDTQAHRDDERNGQAFAEFEG